MPAQALQGRQNIRGQVAGRQSPGLPGRPAASRHPQAAIGTPGDVIDLEDDSPPHRAHGGAPLLPAVQFPLFHSSALVESSDFRSNHQMCQHAGMNEGKGLAAVLPFRDRA